MARAKIKAVSIAYALTAAALGIAWYWSVFAIPSMRWTLRPFGIRFGGQSPLVPHLAFIVGSVITAWLFRRRLMAASGWRRLSLVVWFTLAGACFVRVSWRALGAIIDGRWGSAQVEFRDVPIAVAAVPVEVFYVTIHSWGLPFALGVLSVALLRWVDGQARLQPC